MQQLQAMCINFLFCKITEVTVLTGVVEEYSDTSETQKRGLKMKVELRIRTRHQLEEFVARRTENQQPWRAHQVMPDYTAQVIFHTHLHPVYENFILFFSLELKDKKNVAKESLVVFMREKLMYGLCTC